MKPNNFPSRFFAFALLLCLLGAHDLCKTLAFHFPWDQGHDTFTPDDPDDEDNPPEDEERDCYGDPVDLKSGNFSHFAQDLVISGRGSGLALQYVYHSQDRFNGPFGRGWHSIYSSMGQLVTDGTTNVLILRQGDGKRKRHIVNPDGTVQSAPGLFQRIVAQGGGVRVIDKDGTAREFNAEGRLARVIDRYGNALVLAYDAAGVIQTATDAGGRSLTFTKGADGRIASVRDPRGGTYSYSYNAAGNLASVTDPLGRQCTYAYAANGNMTSIVDARGTTILVNVYDANDRVTRQTTVDGASVFTYFADHTRVTDPRGYTTHHYFNDCGNPTTTTDPLGRTIIRQWDGDFNLISYRDARANLTRFQYDANGNVMEIVNPLGVTTRFTYEPSFFQVSSVTDSSGRVTTFNYDSNGNLVSAIDPSGNRTEMSYDSRGQLISFRDSLGQVASFAYDNYGNVTGSTDALGNSTQTEYDLHGNPTASIDAEGRRSTYTYDALNRRVEARLPDSSVIRYEYDQNDNLTRLTDPKGNSTSFAYDTKNRLIRVTDARGKFSSSTYDANNNITSVVNRNGQTLSFTYDAVNQLIRKTLPNGDIVTFGYDAAGNRVTASDSDSQLAFTFDAGNRLATASTAGSPAQPGTLITYEYELNGNRARVSDPTGVVAYTHDIMNRLTQVTSHSGEIFAFDYDAIGRETRRASPNGVASVSSYNNNSQLTGIAHRFNDLDFTRLGYSFDRTGNRTGINQLRSALPVQADLEFNYDAQDRLISATHVLAGNPAEQFQYDAVGNRSRRDSQAQDSVFDAVNRLLEDATDYLGYDDNGNVIARTNKLSAAVTRYVYDPEDRLSQVTLPDGRTVAYRYDALGRRIEKSVDGQLTRYVYDHEDILLEYSGTQNTLVARFLHGPGVDAPLMMERDTNGDGTFSAGERFFYHADHSGSILDLTDSSGAVVKSYVYDSFGGIVHETGTLPNPYAYTGREFDPETGLYYYRARYYDPTSGRFLSADPFGVLWVVNRYAYVDNNPVNKIDPDGQLAWFIAIPLWMAADYLYDEFVDPHVEEFIDQNFSCEVQKQIRMGKNLLDLARTLKNPARLGIKSAKKGLHRPYVRKDVRREVERRAPKTPDGRYIDPNTGKPIDGKYDLGHKPDSKFSREKAKAEAEGLSQKEFNDRMNNPDKYQIEDPSSNRSHRYEGR